MMCLCLGILAPRGANSADPSIRVTDKFGRVLNEFGIVLVDWKGYMANPAIAFFLTIRRSVVSVFCQFEREFRTVVF